MVVRAEVLRERLAALRETLIELQRLRGLDLGARLHEWAVERGLQVAAQAIFDIGNHVLAGGLGERVQDYAAIPTSLAAHGVISKDLEQRLRGLAGFRNILVHGYSLLKHERVWSVVKDHLPTLLSEVESLLQAAQR